MEIITNLTYWYRHSDEKMKKVAAIHTILEGAVSKPTIIGWLSGMSRPRKKGQIEAISAVSGIDPIDLFQTVIFED